jgi:hypothetical protein
MRIISAVKQIIVPAGAKPRMVRAGLLKSITLDLDLRNQAQVYWGTAELELARYFREYSKVSKTAVDIGASVGFYSLFWLTKTSVEKVIAFEPGHDEKHRLLRNLEINGIIGTDRFELIPKFVGTKDNDESCTLDSFLPRIKMPCVIKLDIEGAEVDVLNHATELLAKQEVRWIIEVHALHLENECLKILRKAGYKTKVVSQAWWRALLPERRLLEHNRWIVAERG